MQDAASLATEALYLGETLSLTGLGDGFSELRFDRQSGAVNKFDQQTVAELSEAIGKLERLPGTRGLLVSSGKSDFIVGADIREFGATFALSHGELLNYLARSNAVFVRFEDLPFPTVAAVHGHALGGGLELALAASHRILAEDAKVGLPEVGLGLIPGFGGTVRLPRIAGLPVALSWVALGHPHGAAEALRDGVADLVVSRARLRQTALEMLRSAASSSDWMARCRAKRAPHFIGATHLNSLREAAARSYGKSSLLAPAALEAAELMLSSSQLDGAQALKAEARSFAKLPATRAARALVQLFVNEQQVRKLGRTCASGHVSQNLVVVAAEESTVSWFEKAASAKGLRLQVNKSPSGDTFLLGCTDGAGPAAVEPGGCAVPVRVVDASAIPSLVEVRGIAAAQGDALRGALSLVLRLGGQPLVEGGRTDWLVTRLAVSLTRGWGLLATLGFIGPRLERLRAEWNWPDSQSIPVEGSSEQSGETGPSMNGDDAVKALDLLLLPMVLEAACAFDQNVVGTAAEVDMAAVWGLQLPRHLGGPLLFADWLGWGRIRALRERYRALGQPLPWTAGLQRMANANLCFYPATSSGQAGTQ